MLNIPLIRHEVVSSAGASTDDIDQWDSIAEDTPSWQDEFEPFGEPTKSVPIKSDSSSDGPIRINNNNFTKKDEERLQRLRSYVDTMHQNAAEFRARNEGQREEAFEYLNGSIDDWADRSNKYIPESRQDQWKNHLKQLAKTEDPAAVKDRIETVLSLMQQLGDDRINLADTHDRASDERITEITRDFRRFDMKDYLSGTDLGDTNLKDFVAPLSKRDRGILEDLLFASPQGKRVFQEIWPERFWDDHDRAIVAEAEDRNAHDYMEARNKAEASGELKDIIRARQKRQGGLALTEWGGHDIASHRVAELLAIEKEYSDLSGNNAKKQSINALAPGKSADEIRKEGISPAEYWEKCYMDAPGMDNDSIEVAIDVLNALNKDVDASKAVAIMKEYELDPAAETALRQRILFFHPRGLEFYANSIKGEPTAADRSMLDAAAAINEKIEKGINKRLKAHRKARFERSAIGQSIAETKYQKELADAKSAAEEREKELANQSPEDRAAILQEKTNQRNAREAKNAVLRQEIEKRKLREAEEAIADALKTKQENWFSANPLQRAKFNDDIERAKKALDLARRNLAGAKEIELRANRGEM